MAFLTSIPRHHDCILIAANICCCSRSNCRRRRSFSARSSRTTFSYNVNYENKDKTVSSVKQCPELCFFLLLHRQQSFDTRPSQLPVLLLIYRVEFAWQLFLCCISPAIRLFFELFPRITGEFSGDKKKTFEKYFYINTQVVFSFRIRFHFIFRTVF